MRCLRAITKTSNSHEMSYGFRVMINQMGYYLLRQKAWKSETQIKPFDWRENTTCSFFSCFSFVCKSLECSTIRKKKHTHIQIHSCAHIDPAKEKLSPSFSINQWRRCIYTFFCDLYWLHYCVCEIKSPGENEWFFFPFHIYLSSFNNAIDHLHENNPKTYKNRTHSS